MLQGINCNSTLNIRILVIYLIVTPERHSNQAYFQGFISDIKGALSPPTIYVHSNPSTYSETDYQRHNGSEGTYRVAR